MFKHNNPDYNRIISNIVITFLYKYINKRNNTSSASRGTASNKI